MADSLVEQPRERLIAYGAEELSVQELLAIILQTGTPKHSVYQLATNVLRQYETLSHLQQTSHKELMTIEGIGPVKATQILAMLEMGKRLAVESFVHKQSIESPEEAVGLILPKMRYLRQEHFICMYLDSKHQLLHSETLYIGGVSEVLISPREVFLKALQYNAAKVICFHNHPSGDISPSKADISATKRLRDSGELLGVPLVDHIIIGDGDFYSFRRGGY